LQVLCFDSNIKECWIDDEANNVSDAETILNETDSKMQKAITATQNEFNSLRTGRANPQILDRVVVDYYGTATPVRQMSNVSVPDGQTILIQPYDKSGLADIEKAISKSDLGLTPNNDGSVIRLNIPPLTEDRRKEMAKLVKKYSEEGKVAVRNVRRDSQDAIKKLEKEASLSEDEIKRHLEELQKLTDKFVAQLDTLGAEKEKELLTL
jgi:ribosome recycling factor